jgi:dihydroflavonol-4-reductase
MILVTGSTGLIGSHLIYNLLTQGRQVKALVRKVSDKGAVLRTFQYYSSDAQELFNRIIWTEGDITDIYSLEEAFQDVDQVYHTAGFVSFSSRNKNKIIETNVNGTANIVNLCLQKGNVKLCFVSSIAALGTTNDGTLITEEVMWIPTKKEIPYSLSKFKSEMEVWRGINEGLDAVIVNPSVVLGPGNRNKTMGYVIKLISKGILPCIKGSTGFVNVVDVASVMTKLMESDITSERFILSSENVSFKELFIWIADYLGKKTIKINVAVWLNKNMVSMANKELYYSSEKIRQSINFNFIPLKQTIENLILHYRRDKS